MRIRTPKPATILAVAALAVTAFGVTPLGQAAKLIVPKNSVRSAHVVDGSLQSADLSAKTMLALRGSRGPQGARGSQGVQGIRGPAGQQGAPGPQGFQGQRGPYAARYLVHVDWKGNVISEEGGAIGVTKDPDPSAKYTLTFPGDVSHCYPVANAEGGPGEFIVMDGFSGSTLTVRTNDYSGFPQDASFYLALVCA